MKQRDPARWKLITDMWGRFPSDKPFPDVDVPVTYCEKCCAPADASCSFCEKEIACEWCMPRHERRCFKRSVPIVSALAAAVATAPLRLARRDVVPYDADPSIRVPNADADEDDDDTEPDSDSDDTMTDDSESTLQCLVLPQ